MKSPVSSALKRKASDLTGLSVALTYDLRGGYLEQGFTEAEVAEFDSESTIESLETALQRLGCSTERVGNGIALAEKLAQGKRWDLVFNIAEGLYGRSREAQVPALLEMYGVNYTFSDPLACALTLDKAMAKRIVASAGLATPSFMVVQDPSDIDDIHLDFPLFAKPLAEGTGKGVDRNSRIETAGQLRQTCVRLLEQFNQPVLVEQYLPGREFTTAILGTGTEARVLGTMEFTIRRDAPSADYSYEVKEQCETYVHYFAMPDEPLREAVEALALDSYRALQCRDTGRVDIRVDAQGRPSFVELNPLPGLHPTHSDLPMIATQQGMEYTELIRIIVSSAVQRKESTTCRAVRPVS
ncbi:MAG: hypothetical protein JW828_06500 [Sedimentisphaerales bacterium]|nr:hypothetical protein [Sedimentisphaerales bacterium]